MSILKNIIQTQKDIIYALSYVGILAVNIIYVHFNYKTHRIQKTIKGPWRIFQVIWDRAQVIRMGKN